MDKLKFTSVADSSQMEHARRSQELQSGVSPGLPEPCGAAVSQAGPRRGLGTVSFCFRQAGPCLPGGPLGCLWELESLLSLPHPLPSSAGLREIPTDILLFRLSELPTLFFLPLLSLFKDAIILQPVENDL